MLIELAAKDIGHFSGIGDRHAVARAGVPVVQAGDGQVGGERVAVAGAVEQPQQAGRDRPERSTVVPTTFDTSARRAACARRGRATGLAGFRFDAGA